ncbi:Tripartite motif-containing protein 16 Estrogen-responsive B box protein [Channa argus]|uniref:Tripartite motif-containing protein 16 Estrogen-responsive B box protein n=1 Tax=Channa argus TaxID=215402 RepID=A0A6G1PEK7_CHAAH|nr:Tripartite motif-containing protein 16 Estrogen-responsive B box protein [Channa argus]
MGAVLDTPTKCPLCGELTREPVTLKCNHRFCRRCIGDLWSVTPNGPYNCPQWRCKTVYQSLPIDSSLIRPPNTSPPTPYRSSAGASSNHEKKTFDSILTRPSLASKYLGKRKASTPVSEQPHTKRSTMAFPNECPSDTEIPTTSSSDKNGQSAGQETTKKAVDPEPAVPQCDNVKFPDSKAAGDVSQDISNPQTQQSFKAAISLDDSDSSSEVDICDAPCLATPRKDTQERAIHASPTKPASPANSDSVSGVSTPGNDKSPVHNTSNTPLKFTKQSASTSGSPGHVGMFSRSDNKNTSPVPCHYCPKARFQPAVKTCLVCGASMCTEHLRPHLDSPVFQNHTLVSPMEDISPWRCQEHQEINRIYCRQCGICVCTVCTVIGSHRDHVCISIREAERELRGNLKEEIKQLQDAEQQVKNRMTDLTEKRESFTVVLTEAREGVQQHYRTIREALEQEEQSTLQCVIKEETRVLGGLEDKLSHLQSSLQSIQQGLHTLEGLADARGDKRVQDQAFIIEYAKIAQLANNMGSCVERFEAPEEVDRAKLKCLQKWTEKRLDTVINTVPGKERDLYRLLYGTVPFLDAETAHPKLQLSHDNRTVTYSEPLPVYKENEARFSSFPQVLALSALASGRWYWEVNVSVDDGRWKVGLCEGQIERKGQKDNSRLGFNSYSWCLACDKKKVEALHNKVSVPVDADRLQRVGVFLDLEEGVLSFFNVTPEGSLALMHSYKHRFTDPVYPALSVSKTQLSICDLFQL